mmetsp:Transcript_10675/g.14625  ORF Transcript_10675/g.14625 Transcript_10675/m.14625 type:complete len:371 (-) Transcript_10675:11-1123(-)
MSHPLSQFDGSLCLTLLRNGLKSEEYFRISETIIPEQSEHGFPKNSETLEHVPKVTRTEDNPSKKIKITPSSSLPTDDDPESCKQKALKCREKLLALLLKCDPSMEQPKQFRKIIVDTFTAAVTSKMTVDQVDLISSILKIYEDLDEQKLTWLCNFVVTPDLAFQTSLAFVHCTLLPKIVTLTSTASRVLLSSTTSLAKKFPKLAVCAVLLPLIADAKLGSAQSEIFTKVLKELPSDMVVLCFRGILCMNADVEDPIYISLQTDADALLITPLLKPFEWRESLIQILQNIITMKVAMPQDIIDALIMQLQERIEQFKDSLKYSNLVFQLIQNYASQLKEGQHSHVETLKTMMSKCNTFMSKGALNKLNQL